MLHFAVLRIAKSTVNICYFAFPSSPNCKKHCKYMFFFHSVALRIAKSTVNIKYFALVTSHNCKKLRNYMFFCYSCLSTLQTNTVNISYLALCSSPNCKKHKPETQNSTQKQPTKPKREIPPTPIGRCRVLAY